MPSLEDAWTVLERSELVAAEDEVRAAIARLADEVTQSYRDRYPLVLAVMGGAVVFAGQLLPLLRFPLDFDYVHASRYGDATRGGEIHWRMRPPQVARGRDVLVVDDILDGGITMQAIRTALLELGARSFACAVLVDKSLSRPKPLQADFVGLRIDDRFVFGCGMDAGGHWRNLPEIRAVGSGAC